MMNYSVLSLALVCVALLQFCIQGVNAAHLTYYFTVAYTRGAPDGVPTDILAVNGSFPGPAIRCNLGDTLHVHVTNKIKGRRGETFDLAVHWHGLLQYGTIFADGPDLITQCPIKYGKTFEYVFTPNQTGTYW
jgi:FtsP/CotA-like multicopper oxidase with cupredoxin domain